MEKLGAKHQNLDRKIYHTLKSMIIERKLAPGTKILQDKLAHELGVSRTPLVNALKMLEHEKLISSKPRRGFFVRLFSKQEMVHIFELREVLEGLAARRAATQATDNQIDQLMKFFEKLQAAADAGNQKKYAEEDRKFHTYLVKIGGKEFLSSILESYNIVTFSYQFQRQEGLVRVPQQTIGEHQAIVEAISKREPDNAEKQIRNHLSNSTEELKRELQKEQELLKAQEQTLKTLSQAVMS